MLLLAIRKEIISNVLSFRFAVTYALVFCLVLLAVFLMASDFGAKMGEYTTEQAKVREKLDNLAAIEDPSEQYREFQQADLSGARQPRPLSILARGLEGSLPTQVSTGRRWFQSSDDRLGRNALFEIFQAPDFVYVVNVVMSLIALLFVFDSICGEKERGTLKIALSNSVPRDTILLSKWIGGYVSVAGPFAVAALGGYAYIYLSGAVVVDESTAQRFGVIFGLSLLYVSTFFTLGLMISAFTHRSSTALVVSLMVWICWILVVPNVAPIAARLMAPVPARQVIEAEKQAIDREAQLLLEGIGKRKVYGDAKESERIRDEAEHRQEKLEDFYSDRMRRQISWSQNLARVSPSASYLFAATRLAGTGPNLFRQFQSALDQFREAQQDYRRDLQRRNVVEYTRSGPRVSDPDWFKPDDLPRFTMSQEGVLEALNLAYTDILLLAVYNVLFFMLAFVSFLRYDVT